MSIDELFEVAEGVLKAHGVTPAFRRTPEIALYRCETLSDRHVELILREKGWTLSYVHLPTHRTVRVKGKDSGGLERSLAPLCQETAFEPPAGAHDFPRFS